MLFDRQRNFNRRFGIGLRNWIAAQPSATLCTTSINQAEILYGIVALPEGRRRTALVAAAEAMFTEDLARVLPFDAAAAARYAGIVTTRRRAGSPIEAFDALKSFQAASTRSSIDFSAIFHPFRNAPTQVSRFTPSLVMPFVRRAAGRRTLCGTPFVPTPSGGHGKRRGHRQGAA